METNLNCDLGEKSFHYDGRNDQALMQIINTANIACGYHAGNKETMTSTIKLAKENNITMVQLAQAFVNSRPFVTSNIIGATSMDQLKENIGSINVTLNQDTLDKINLIHNNNPNPAP